MTHKTTITDNYILITSDEEIKEGDWVIDKHNSIYLQETDKIFQQMFTHPKKIIYHLPLNNALKLEGVPLLPPLPSGKEKYRFTEEDMRMAMDKMAVISYSSEYGMSSKFKERKKYIDNYIQSLSQPKIPIEFNIEYNEINWGGTIERKEPKIINGVMQGEWIY